MKKLLLSLCMVLALAACKDEQKAAQQTPEKPVIKVGASLPLTGNMAYIGISAQKSLQMALDKWNQKNTKYKYELIVEDDAFDAKRVALITNKLINQDKIKALFTIFSIGANVASPITQQAKVIHMTSAYGSQPADGYYNFNNMTQYDNQTELMFNELKKRGIKTIGMLISNNIGSTQQAEMLVNKIKNDGTIKIIGKEIFNPGTRDFRMIIQKMIEDGEPDIFYVDGITPDATLVAKYLRELTGKINLTTINDFIETPAREYFENLWFVESASGTDEFLNEYEARYGEPVFLCGANTYDNLDLFIDACEKSDHCDSDEIVPILLSIKDREGAIGKFSIDENGIVQSQANVKIIKNGKAVKIEE
ncbi:MAG: ABC transporter substrate-binding protein [Alphaproteobacteria bacterium]|nr:ABC transporter substrate-binding protein [Alphaproteobacteria bacterium]